MRRPARILGIGMAAALALAAGRGDGQEVPFTVAGGGWDTGTLGNHRVVLRVPTPARAVHAVIAWRRRDEHPESRRLVVTTAAGERIANVRLGEIGRERGELWFEPIAGAGTYLVYYLPFVSAGSANYPKVSYPPPVETADPAWLAGLASGGAAGEAVVEAIQAADELDSFSPMEVIATAEETRVVLARFPGAPFLVFPEDREHAIRMSADLPYRWVAAGPAPAVTGEAARGEYFAYQLGVYAVEPLDDVRVAFSDLTSASGRVIPSARLNCINTGGIGWDGRPFSKQVDVPAGAVQALWCGVDVPADAAPGAYSGTATVSAAGRAPVAVRLEVTVSERVAADGGAGEPWKQTRLKWLDSTLAQENTVIAPYTPLTVTGTAIGLLGRRVTLGAFGLPEAIATFFSPEMTAIGTTPNPVLAAPMTLVVEDSLGERLAWHVDKPLIVEQTPGTVRWWTVASAGDLDAEVEGALEFDGFASLHIALTARRRADLRDVRLEIPYTRAASAYMMGLGRKGGARPESLDWTWDVATKNQDGAWIGGANAGMAFSLRGDNYVRPLNTNFYLQKPLNLPPSWGNGGRGGITIRERGDAVTVSAFSGARTMATGETQRFDLTLIVTPFHPIDTDAQWATRYYHRFAPVDEVRATGATVVNVHHATPVNPWINYPFIAWREMKAYVGEAHAKGLKVKIYNTVRELSNHAYELFPLRSLGHEVFSPGAGGGFSWLQEHLGGDYIAAWFVPPLSDAAIVNSGMSRWHNYYVEGMRWLVENVGIDGVYLDDVAFDRTTMKRIKRVLTAGGHPGIIDLHSANQFNPRDGFVNSALLYLEHFPYLDRLWFGEYFDYRDNSPDFFLTEVSGIPFGLMGEMLQDGGNPWRGMVYGMTNRMPWSDNADPRPLWQAWDDFGMRGTRMIGYWVAACPVRTGRADVLATVYRRDGAALVALASWAEGDCDVPLAVDWRALGIDPAAATIAAPEIAGFQPARRFAPGEPIAVPRGKGWLLVLTGKSSS
jgi:hypothetical protein